MRKPTLETAFAFISALAPAIVFGTEMYHHAVTESVPEYLAIIAGVSFGFALEYAGLLSAENAIKYMGMENMKRRAIISWVALLVYAVIGIYVARDSVLWIAFPIILIVYVMRGVMITERKPQAKRKSVAKKAQPTIAKHATVETKRETSKRKVRKNQLTESDWEFIFYASAEEIMERFGVKQTTAYDWKRTTPKAG